MHSLSLIYDPVCGGREKGREEGGRREREGGGREGRGRREGGGREGGRDHVTETSRLMEGREDTFVLLMSAMYCHPFGHSITL